LADAVEPSEEATSAKVEASQEPPICLNAAACPARVLEAVESWIAIRDAISNKLSAISASSGLACGRVLGIPVETAESRAAIEDEVSVGLPALFPSSGFLHGRALCMLDTCGVDRLGLLRSH